MSSHAPSDGDASDSRSDDNLSAPLLAADHELEQRVERLCAEGRLEQAARALADSGEHRRASRLFERACAFELAAEEALRADAPALALRLAILAADPGLVRAASQAVVEARDPSEVRRVAEALAVQGHHRQAGDLLARLGDQEAAGEAYERAGAAREAAGAFSAAGKPARAARMLEGALRSGHDSEPDATRVALGRLYARHHKHEAAVRVLQQLPESSSWRREGLVVLARSLEALGLRQALRDLAPELSRHDVSRAEIEASEDAAETTEGTLFGRYRVVREVATTPHARLLEAVDVIVSERVAVKVLASRGQGTGRDALSRFVREARALEKLRHPNVVPLRGYVPEGPAMVLKWMGGGSLRELLERDTLSPARAAEIVRGVLDALGEAHRIGILHRDVKPSNLLFDEAGTACLADFGAAHLAGSEAMVTVGEIGTVAYMAPEQRAGHAASVRSDLYAVGVLMFEMLTGELPEGRGPHRVRGAHPDFSEAHDALFTPWLAHEAADRFGTALEARQAVEAVPWPSRVVARARTTKGAPLDRRESHRLGPPRRRGDAHDLWLERDVQLVGVERQLEVAAFARADHPALPTVCRLDREGRQLWIEAPRGRPLSQGLQLSPAQRARLAEALEALHRAGGAHGSIAPDCVFVHAGEARLAFPSAAREPSPEGDLEALAALP